MAGQLQAVHPVEGFAHAAPHRQDAVVAQNEGFTLPQVLHQRGLLGQIEHHALVVVVANFEETHSRLGEGQQSTFERRHRHGRPAVGVDDAVHLGASLVHRTVDHIAGFVDAVVQVAKVGLGQDVAIVVNFDEARRGDFFVHHAVGVDEKSTVFAGHARRDVVGHHVGHAVDGHQAVTSRQIHPRLPLCGSAACLHRFDFQKSVFNHG